MAVAIGKRDFSVEPPRMGLRRATEVTMRSGNGTPIGFWHYLFDRLIATMPSGRRTPMGFKPKNECKKAG